MIWRTILCRAEVPAFAFVVLNRLNSGNILQFIIPGMEFKREGTFVMYKSTGRLYIEVVHTKNVFDVFIDDIYCGLHFDDATECNRVGDMLARYAVILLIPLVL